MGPTQLFAKLLYRRKQKKGVKKLRESEEEKDSPSAASRNDPATLITESGQTINEGIEQDESSSRNVKESSHGQIFDELFPGGGTLGINVLYAPRSKPLVDIVLIHGLKGHSYTTWLDTRSGTYWPVHLLQRDVPNARIMTFGYDADPMGVLVSGQNDIRDHAHTLLGDLARERKSDPVRIPFPDRWLYIIY